MILTSVCRVDVALAASAVTNKGTACFGVSQVRPFKDTARGTSMKKIVGGRPPLPETDSVFWRMRADNICSLL